MPRAIGGDTVPHRSIAAMNTLPYSFRLERPEDSGAIENLVAKAFGPGRFARAAYRLREAVPHLAGLSFVAEHDGVLIGSARLTPITVGDRAALLLGPLVVDPDWKGKGCGRGLVKLAVGAARDAGHELVILVGDLAYYGPLGFRRVEPAGAVTLPGPVDPARLLVAELKAGAAAGLSGTARGNGSG
jgi:predicted N-acetyltransferase YhbS